jgi:hypothetical protein
MADSGHSESRWLGFSTIEQCETARKLETTVMRDGKPAEIWASSCAPVQGL